MKKLMTILTVIALIGCCTVSVAATDAQRTGYVEIPLSAVATTDASSGSSNGRVGSISKYLSANETNVWTPTGSASVSGIPSGAIVTEVVVKKPTISTSGAVATTQVGVKSSVMSGYATASFNPQRDTSIKTGVIGTSAASQWEVRFLVTNASSFNPASISFTNCTLVIYYNY